MKVSPFIILLLCILLIAIQASVYAVELTEEDNAVCTKLSSMAVEVQTYRRNSKATQAEAIEEFSKSDKPLVYKMLIDKVYTIPLAVPPIAVGLDLQGHCLIELQKIRELQLESKFLSDNKQSADDF
jgi:ligand-binding sensor protein